VPRVYVEAGFGQSIGTAKTSIEWTNITEYVRAADGLSFHRGREAVGEAPSAGTLSMSLDNNDGRFTPGLTSGPYGSGVVTRIPLRVRASVDTDGDGEGVPVDYGDDYGDEYGGDAAATLYELWYGFVTDIEWNPGVDMTAKIQAADILAQSGKIVCRPWLTGRYLGQAPTFYWPLTDEAGATELRSPVAGVPPLVVSQARGEDGSFDTGVVSDLDESTVTAFTPAGDDNGKWASVTTTAPDDVQAVAVWFRGAGTLCSWHALPTANMPSPYAPRIAAIEIKDGTLWARESATSKVDFAGSGAEYTFNEDEWSFVLVVRDQWVPTDADGNSVAGYHWRVWRAWQGGVVELSSAVQWRDWYARFPYGWPIGFGVGGHVVSPYSMLDPTPVFNGQIAHVAIFSNPSDPEALAEILGNNGATDPTAATRFLDLANVTTQPAIIESWMSADSTADITISQQPSKDVKLIDLGQQVAVTERGSLIADRSGTLRLQSSRSRLTETVALQLDATVDVLSFDGAFAVDDADAVDTLTVTAQPSQAVYTGDRVDYFGLETATQEVWTDDRVHAQAVADGIANWPANIPKAPRLSVSMTRMTAAGLDADVLALELGDLIRVTDLPATAPDTTVDLIVEAIDHDISIGDWVVTFDTSPGELASGGVVGTSGALSTVATTLKVRP
jgi:hypothetical protein